MKLTTIAIEGYRQLQHLNLRQISPNLNVIYGERGSGKTQIANFLRTVFFADEGGWSDTSQPVLGTVEVRQGANQYRLTRGVNCQLTIDSLTHSRDQETMGLSALTGPLDAQTYQMLFDISFDPQNIDDRDFAQFLHRRIGIPTGVGATGDPTATTRADDLSNRLSADLETARRELHNLNNRHRQYAAQTRKIESQVRTELNSIDTEINRVVELINQLQKPVDPTTIDREIHELRMRIENAQPTYAPQPTSPQDRLEGLYAQLDEIDNQLRRWISVQNDVQQQRVRLKDEMLLWNQLTLESESHPYHNAREILLSLESKVDRAQSQTVQWLESHGPVDARQAATFIEDNCEAMREDLYRLCDELSQQYKHIRHKSAASELKQLRRCYEEMGENTQRLATRRETLLAEIRKFDPAGADIILRGEAEFCNCAHHEGYLRARRRFVGEMIAPQSVVPIGPDLSLERSRISALEAQRLDLDRQTTLYTSDLSRLQAEEVNLKNRRQTILDSSNLNHVTADQRNLDAEIQLAHQRISSIEQELRTLSATPMVAPDPVLVHAAQLLKRLTHGELTGIWIDATTSTGSHVSSATSTSFSQSTPAVDLQVRDLNGKVFNSSALPPSSRILTCLSLILAAHQHLVKLGVGAPIIFDELFNSIENERISSALDVLTEFANTGKHQVLLLTQHRFLIDRLPGAQWFDIENRTGVPRSTPPQPTVPAPIASVPAPSQPAPFAHRTAPHSASHTSFDYRTPKIYVAPNPSDSQWQVRTTPLSANDASHYAHRPSRQPSQPSPGIESVNLSTVTSIGADQIGDRLEYTISFDEHSRLSEVPVFDASQLRILETTNVVSVAQFLAFDATEVPRQWVEVGLNESMLTNLQSEIWLLTCVPALRASDARVLVACGITEPRQLETSDPQALHERIGRYLQAHENGQTNFQPITRARISDWHRGLSRTRQRWQRGRTSHRRPDDRSLNGTKRRYDRADNAGTAPSERLNNDRTEAQLNSSYGPKIRKFEPNSNSHYDSAPHRPRSHRPSRTSSNRPHHDIHDQREEREPRVSRQPRENRQPREASRYRDQDQNRQPRPARMQTPTPERTRRAIPALAPSDSRRAPEIKPAATRATRSSNTSSSKKKDKFYLDLDDHIEAAPSIGPKTAERFEKIGVKTIDQFLKQTAESMATKLNYKRITEVVVRNWQHQARLVCRIPNLRGHDAQILVACNMLEPEEIAAMRPQALFEFVGPFSETKEGQKIIRSGKKPDLAEVSDWVEWAQKNRSLQAA